MAGIFHSPLDTATRLDAAKLLLVQTETLDNYVFNFTCFLSRKLACLRECFLAAEENNSTTISSLSNPGTHSLESVPRKLLCQHGA